MMAKPADYHLIDLVSAVSRGGFRSLGAARAAARDRGLVAWQIYRGDRRIEHHDPTASDPPVPEAAARGAEATRMSSLDAGRRRLFIATFLALFYWASETVALRCWQSARDRLSDEELDGLVEALVRIHSHRVTRLRNQARARLGADGAAGAEQR